jgi:hypothetical protein
MACEEEREDGIIQFSERVSELEQGCPLEVGLPRLPLSPGLVGEAGPLREQGAGESDRGTEHDLPDVGRIHGAIPPYQSAVAAPAAGPSG